MSFDPSADAFLVQLRADLAACAIWISEVASAGQEANHIHYPYAVPSGSQGTSDPLPIALLSMTGGGTAVFAEGAGGLRTNTDLVLDLYLEASTAGGSPSTPRTNGYLESFASTILSQLLSRPRIIPYRGTMTWEMASDPTPGAWASDDAGATRACAFHHLKIRLPTGFNL